MWIVEINYTEPWGTLCQYVHTNPRFTVDDGKDKFTVKVLGQIASEYKSGPDMLRTSLLLAKELIKHGVKLPSTSLLIGYAGCDSTQFQPAPLTENHLYVE